MPHLTKDEEREIAARAREKGEYVLAWGEDARSGGERAYYGAQHFESTDTLLEELDHDEGDVRAYFARVTPGGLSILQPLAARLLRQAADKWDPSALLRQIRDLEDWTQSDLAGRLGLEGSSGQVTVTRWESGDVRPEDDARERFQELADELDPHYETCAVCGEGVLRSGARRGGGHLAHPKCVRRAEGEDGGWYEGLE